MARQAINLGSGADSGTGDTHAAAFTKIEANFVELYGRGTTVTESTTARTIGLTDDGKYIRLTHASGCAITIPEQAVVTWLDETEIGFRVAGAVAPTFTLGTGVTLNTNSPTLAQHSTFALKRVAENIWDLI
jgi:phage tail protein X